MVSLNYFHILCHARQEEENRLFLGIYQEWLEFLQARPIVAILD
jgi:hypothetical protein